MKKHLLICDAVPDESIQPFPKIVVPSYKNPTMPLLRAHISTP